MNEQSSKTPSSIEEQLQHSMPLPDDRFQQELEDKLISEWYQVTGTAKQKRSLRVRVPFTYVASLIAILITTGIIVIQSPLIKPSNAGSSVNSPVPTQIPTPKLATATPDMYTNPGEVAVQLAPDTVAYGLELDSLSVDGHDLTVGDVIGIRAQVNRTQAAQIPEPVQSEVMSMLVQYNLDELDAVLVQSAVIIKIEADVHILTLQISQQDAVVLTWLINSQIPYQIELTTMPETANIAVTVAPDKIIFPLTLPMDQYMPLQSGQKINISASFTRDEFPILRKKIISPIGAMSEDVANNTLTVQLVTEAVVVRSQKKIGIIALQLSANEATTLQWLIDSQIPYKIEMAN